MRFNNIRDNISKSNCSSENSQNSKTLLKDNINYQNKEKGSKLVEDFTDVFDNDNPEERLRELKQYIKKQEQEDPLFLIGKLAGSDEGNFYDDYENTGLDSWEEDEILDSLKPTIVDTLKEYEGKIRDHLLFKGGTFANLDENLIYEIHRYITYISDHIDGDDPEIYKDLYDEITYKNMYRILEELNCLSLDEILKYVGDVPTYDKPDWVGPMFILPDGKFIYVQEVCGKNSIHSSIIEKIIENYIKENYPTAKINVNIKDYALDFMGELLDLGLVRCNTGSTASDRRFYCVVPSSDFARPTTRQYYGLLDYLDLAKDYVMVYGGDDDYQKYYMSDNTPDDILKKIKRYYTSGTLYEKLEIIDDIYTGNTNHSVKKSNIYADIYYDRHERMYTVCLKDKSNGDILSDNQWVFNKQEANTVKQDMLENPQSFIYDYYEIIDESLKENISSDSNKVNELSNKYVTNEFEYRTWIRPDGKMIKAPISHGSTIIDLYDDLGHPMPDINDSKYDDYVDDCYKYFSNLGWIQIGVDCKYCYIAKKPTSEQYDTLLDYLDYMSTQCDHCEVSLGNKARADYKFDNYISDDIVKKIKQYYETGMLREDLEEDKVEKVIKSKNYEQMSDIEMISYIYNGELRNGVHYDNYKHNKGDKVLVYDAWVNAKDKYSALNKLRRKLGFDTLSKDELDSDIEDRYCTVEESNYYDEKHNVTYKWYVSYEDVELPWLKEEFLNEVYPNKGESKKDFTKRFMKATKKEYPDIKQRYAVCMSYWNRRNKKRKNESLTEDADLNRNIKKLIDELKKYDIKLEVIKENYDTYRCLISKGKFNKKITIYKLIKPVAYAKLLNNYMETIWKDEI